MIRAVLACEGQEGIFPCKQATPVGVVGTGAEARRIAAQSGWTTKIYNNHVLDLCPACTLRLSLGKLPQINIHGLAS